ncbi:hypothetical protein [Cellulomonas fimi]|uniref:hypothetical protein n=1 Tax=Cellulomonas fimi TaxID=1708 RepID=UPI0023593934|nr:hypothetical protein [Cellulomonas fimi]
MSFVAPPPPALAGLPESVLAAVGRPLPASGAVHVAGVGGGVGTTTVAGLVWSVLALAHPGAVGLTEHAAVVGGGGLGGGRVVARVDGEVPTTAPVVVHDRGPLAAVVAESEPGPSRVLVVVCRAHAAGIADAARAVERVGVRGPDDLRRVVVAAVATTGAAPGTRAVADAADRLGLAVPLVVVPFSRHLAAGGALPGPDLRPLAAGGVLTSHALAALTS